MAIDTWFIVQKWLNYDWVDRTADGSDWYTTLDDAKYFCDSYIKDGERCRIVKQEVVYDPDRKPK